MNNRHFLTIKEVANLFKLNIITIYSFIRSRKLQAVKFGRKYRIEETELERFIRDNSTHKATD